MRHGGIFAGFQTVILLSDQEIISKGIVSIMEHLRNLKYLSLIGLLSLFVNPGHARVFMFEEESVAPFVNLRTGVTSMGADPYRWQSAPSNSGDEVSFVYGGEFGVYFRGGSFGVALGVLVHTFDPVTGGKGFNAAGAELFSVASEGMAYGPSLQFDYQLSSTKTYLWKLLVGGGYQFMDIENTYSFSATGQSLVGGQSSLTESYKAAAPFVMLGVSTEFIMSGTTTISVTAGYHYSFASEWAYGEGGENFAGSHAQGDTAVFEDGTSRGIQWSYPFVQVGFQFYVDTAR